jgi:hypothetical protein
MAPSDHGGLRPAPFPEFLPPFLGNGLTDTGSMPLCIGGLSFSIHAVLPIVYRSHRAAASKTAGDLDDSPLFTAAAPL